MDFRRSIFTILTTTVVATFVIGCGSKSSPTTGRNDAAPSHQSTDTSGAADTDVVAEVGVVAESGVEQSLDAQPSGTLDGSRGNDSCDATLGDSLWLRAEVSGDGNAFDGLEHHPDVPLSTLDSNTGFIDVGSGGSGGGSGGSGGTSQTAADTARDITPTGGTSGNTTSAGTSTSPPCPAVGTVGCKTPSTIRTCTSTGWVTTACGTGEVCSAGACRPGCPGLTAAPGALVACYMPTEPHPGVGGRTETAATLSSDPSKLTAASFSAEAYDSEQSALVPAPVVPDAQGLVWSTPPATTANGRMGLVGTMKFQEFILSSGGERFSISLVVKLRSPSDQTRPWAFPEFSLQDGTFTQITQLDPLGDWLPLSTDWTIYNRNFTSGEVSALDLDGSTNTWTMLFPSSLLDEPPRNVDIAWFALTFAPVESGIDAGTDAGLEAMDAEAIPDGAAIDAVDGCIDGSEMDAAPPVPCPTEGATECKDSGTLRTCSDGVWVESQCGSFQVCSVGACLDGCTDLVTKTGAIIACYMPLQPDLPGGPDTATLTTDPTALPKESIIGLASQLTSTDVFDAPTIDYPSGLVWRANPDYWLGIGGILNLGQFQATYGASPKAGTLYVKMRKVVDASRKAPDPIFRMYDGAAQVVATDYGQSWLQPTTEWAIHTRILALSEIAALSLDGRKNFWRIIFEGLDLFAPPEPVEVAWFALALVPPNGKYDLAVTKSGSGGGIVTSSPAGIDCGSICQAEFTIDSQVGLEATPDANSVFTGWSGACSGTSTCVLTMNAPKAVSATFAHRYLGATAGRNHSCGVRGDNTAVCWGSNTYGQTTAPSGSFASAGAGGFHSCGLRGDNTVTCWGDNTYGQLTAPAGTFAQVAAGLVHSCALKADGTLTCWGYSGDGRSTAPSGTFSSVSAGNYHSCGVTSTAACSCWGQNANGQATPPSDSFTAVSAGGWHTCGIKSDGTVACWGLNGDGRATPPAGTFLAVSAGQYHTCAIKTDATVTCWGFNGNGQATAPPGTFTSISAGGWHTCGVKTDQSVICWGNNGSGQTTQP